LKYKKIGNLWTAATLSRSKRDKLLMPTYKKIEHCHLALVN